MSWRDSSQFWAYFLPYLSFREEGWGKGKLLGKKKKLLLLWEFTRFSNHPYSVTILHMICLNSIVLILVARASHWYLISLGKLMMLETWAGNNKHWALIQVLQPKKEQNETCTRITPLINLKKQNFVFSACLCLTLLFLHSVIWSQGCSPTMGVKLES